MHPLVNYTLTLQFIYEIFVKLTIYFLRLQLHIRRSNSVFIFIDHCSRIHRHTMERHAQN